MYGKAVPRQDGYKAKNMAKYKTKNRCNNKNKEKQHQQQQKRKKCMEPVWQGCSQTG